MEKMRCYLVFDLFSYLFHANTFYCQKLMFWFFYSFFFCAAVRVFRLFLFVVRVFIISVVVSLLF